MGGFFGAVSKRDCVLDIFFGVDYHSHLGTKRGGMVIHDAKTGFQRQIHNISNTPFRTKFENDLRDFHGCSGIGCSATPTRSRFWCVPTSGCMRLRRWASSTMAEELVDNYFSDHGHQFMAMSSGKVNQTELIAALINEMNDLVSGIRHAQEQIEGSATILILKEDGSILAARDRMGRLPVLIGKGEDGCCVSFESFAYHKLGYEDAYELGPREVVEVTADRWENAVPGRTQDENLFVPVVVLRLSELQL